MIGEKQDLIMAKPLTAREIRQRASAHIRSAPQRDRYRVDENRAAARAHFIALHSGDAFQDRHPFWKVVAGSGKQCDWLG